MPFSIKILLYFTQLLKSDKQYWYPQIKDKAFIVLVLWTGYLVERRIRVANIEINRDGSVRIRSSSVCYTIILVHNLYSQLTCWWSIAFSSSCEHLWSTICSYQDFKLPVFISDYLNEATVYCSTYGSDRIRRSKYIYCNRIRLTMQRWYTWAHVTPVCSWRIWLISPTMTFAGETALWVRYDVLQHRIRSDGQKYWTYWFTVELSSILWWFRRNYFLIFIPVVETERNINWIFTCTRCWIPLSHSHWVRFRKRKRRANVLMKVNQPSFLAERQRVSIAQNQERLEPGKLKGLRIFIFQQSDSGEVVIIVIDIPRASVIDSFKRNNSKGAIFWDGFSKNDCTGEALKMLAERGQDVS